jgi:hypothetical protein
MKALLLVVMTVLCLSGRAQAQLAGETKVVEFRNRVTTALGLKPGTPSKLLDIVSAHIDTTNDWSLKYLTGNDLYGDEYKNKTIRYFMVIIVKDGRTVVDSLSYDLKSGQLILSEVENIVLSISAGIEDSKRMAGESKYEKVSESKSSAIFHKKGYLQEVAFSVNNQTNAIVKTYTDLFYEVVPSSSRAPAEVTPPRQPQAAPKTAKH